MGATFNDKSLLIHFYSTMYKIREFENQVFELYKAGLMPGLAHLYLGEEAVGTGACAALRPDDYIVSTHRGHGHLIARGADTKKMMAEILGKRDGYCKGKGGSMHIMALDKGILGANGIVGAGIPIATGAAYKSKLKDTKQVILSFFGDGASNQGTFHESLNMASAWKLPIVYIIENNLYGISVSVKRVTNVENLSVRAQAYGIKGVTIDGNDVLKVYETIKEAVEFAREGGGPTLIECKTYRIKGHHVGDPATQYRTREEEEFWKERCPILRLKKYLIEKSVLTEKDIQELENEVIQEIKEAVKFAKNSPYPDASEAFEDVYAN
ncbi:MAG: acetoin:2,6-dichlorophenolindophenol oxidoreductase subunit alpha [Thermosediminibacterales bacterium]|jgi:pyruvate dehydrogenase E1 component alpha subunit|nr:acetoin:2,6-dichlorophenolindophenol oxidoreductase subunit alpha [Thermosediminibacterales bacterium]